MGKQYTERFRDEWQKDPKYKDWLNKIEGDDRKCFCKYCKCTIAANLSDINKHSQTQKHRNAEKPFSAQRRQAVLPFKKIDNETRKIEGRIALFIAGHCSFRVVDHLTELCKSCFGDSKGCKDIKLKRTKCRAVICNVLAPHFVEDLKTDIGSGPYSLLIDESNDISVTKLLGIVIRYYSVSKRKIVVCFLDLVELVECNAEAICDALKKSLRDYGLELQKLIAIGTDNASVMTGINNGVYAKLKGEIPHLQLIRCVCHSLQLAVSHAAAEFLPRNLEFLLKDTYNWFAYSALRQSKYRELYSTINDGHEPLKLVQVSQTRWLSIEAAVARILNQWVELKTHFEVAKLSERCYTADILYGMYNDRANYVYLLFLKPILGEIQSVNKKFEAEVNDPTKLLNDLLHLIDSITSKIVIPGRKISLNSNIEEYLDPKPYLGYAFEKEMAECNFPPEQDSFIRGRCVKFLISFIQQVRQRLPDNIDVLKSMSYLSSSECLQPVKCSIIELAKMFESDDEVITRIDFQWKNLHNVKWTETLNTINLWSEIGAYRDATGENPFHDLCLLAFKILTLPHSNADVERVFSQMNIVKCKLRNRMNLKTMTALLFVKYGLRRNKKCCHDYLLPPGVVQKIGTMKSYDSPSQESGEASSSHSQAQVDPIDEDAELWDEIMDFD